MAVRSTQDDGGFRSPRCCLKHTFFFSGNDRRRSRVGDAALLSSRQLFQSAARRRVYYPPAFTSEAPTAIEGCCRRSGECGVGRECRAFCVNAICIDRTIVMAKVADRLRPNLEASGYTVADVDLLPLVLSGGGAFCMMLRLDRASEKAAVAVRERRVSDLLGLALDSDPAERAPATRDRGLLAKERTTTSSSVSRRRS